MSVNLSDIKFPNYVTGIQDEYGEWLAGGYDYQSQAPGWTRVGLINQLIEFNLADLTWHDLGGGADFQGKARICPGGRNREIVQMSQQSWHTWSKA